MLSRHKIPVVKRLLLWPPIAAASSQVIIRAMIQQKNDIIMPASCKREEFGVRSCTWVTYRHFNWIV